jgi:hypothetical protein
MIGHKFDIVLTKIIGVIGLIASISMTPFYIIMCNLSLGYSFIFLLMSACFFTIFWFLLIRTNHPNTRYNLFTINSNWKSRMDYSLSERPAQLFTLDPKDPDIEKMKSRNRKIKSIIDLEE